MAEYRQTHKPLRICAALLTLFASLAGCAKDQSLAPPVNNQQVIVRIKVPSELKAETIKVMYRSTLCTFTDHNAYGEPYHRDGYQNMEIDPAQLDNSDIYEAKLSIDGGGACQWRLSNVNFGVSYQEPERFGKDVSFGAGGGVVVMFDDRRPSRSSGFPIHVDGDLTIKENYYPWVSEAFIGGHRKTMSLAGEGDIYLMYRAHDAREVYFEPVLHSRFVVHSEQPKVHKKGLYSSFTYPDGSIEKTPSGKPNFHKLETIRLAAEKK